MVYTSELLLLIFANLLSVKKALRYDSALGFVNNSETMFLPKIDFRLVAEMWIGYLKLCHNHSVIGLENIPSDGPGKLSNLYYVALCFHYYTNDIRIDSLVPRTTSCGLYGTGG